MDPGPGFSRRGALILQMEQPMNKSDLIQYLAARQGHLEMGDVEMSVRVILESMTQALAEGERIEIRGFGSFALRHRRPRIGRNPRTGDAVALPGKHVPHFKPGKTVRQLVNDGRS